MEHKSTTRTEMKWMIIKMKYFYPLILPLQACTTFAVLILFAPFYWVLFYLKERKSHNDIGKAVSVRTSVFLFQWTLPPQPPLYIYIDFAKTCFLWISNFSLIGVIVDDEINEILVRPLPSGARLHAFVDACHSGTSKCIAFCIVVILYFLLLSDIELFVGRLSHIIVLYRVYKNVFIIYITIDIVVLRSKVIVTKLILFIRWYLQCL